MMKRLVLGLMLGLTATAVRAEWTGVADNGEITQYVDRATIRRNGNLVKMWDLKDFKTVETTAGISYLSMNMQQEYDCKEEKTRTLAISWFSGQMGNGKVVSSTSEPSMKWIPIRPASMGEALWEIACGKK